MVEIREAPVPVRYRWSVLVGVPMTPMWWGVEEGDRNSLFACSFVTAEKHITVELSNGQTIIVRAKK